MTFLCGILHELPTKNHKPLAPLRVVSCMTKSTCRACSCCWVSVVIAILLSFVGVRVLGANAGPLGPFAIGLDYPNFDLIARNSDALKLAQEESSLALLGVAPSSGGRGGFGRRLAETADDFDDETSAEALFAHLSERLVGPHLTQHLKAHRRRLQSGEVAQDQQSSTLAIALLVVDARAGVANLYDDAGIDQMCTFRNGLMVAPATFPDYCLLQDDPEHTGSGEANKVCNLGTDGLPFFFGDSDYDIDQIDVADFAIADFEAIIDAFNAQDYMALAGFSSSDVAKVTALYGKLFGYLTGAWGSNKYVCDLSKKKNVAKVLEVLAHVKEMPALDMFDGVLNQYFDKDFSVANPVTRYTKGFYMYGAPLEGFTNYIENTAVTQQDAQYQRWWTTEKFRSLYPEGTSSLWPTGRPTVLNTKLLLSEIIIVLVGDGIRAVAPCILVYLIVWLQTGSLLIATVTLTEIILSLTTAIFVTTSILQIKWVSFQCALALYIVLAIGADDVFVFVDAYKQSFYRGKAVNASLETRMSWVYRRAGLAMLITSLTTCAAFIASALSCPIPELQNFGIFAAFVIFIDYVLVMTFLCANVVLFHNYFEMKPGLCCACCDDCLCKDWKCSNGGCQKLCSFVAEDLVTTTTLAQEGKAEEVAKSFLIRFFEDTFPFTWVCKKPATRAVSIVICLVALALGVSSAVGITAQTSTENFLPDDHPFQRYSEVNNNFETSNFDSTVEINIIWGFKEADPLDQTGVQLIFDGDFKGVPKYSDTFALTPAAQTALLTACDVLSNSNSTKITIDTASGNTTVLSQCFMRAFKSYRAHKSKSFPVPASEIDAAMEEWMRDDDLTVPQSISAVHGEAGFLSDVGWRKVDDVLTLSWVKVRAESKLNTRAFLPASSTREYYSEWQSVLAEMNALTAATPLGPAFQVSGTGSGLSNKWIYMTVQEVYVRSALTGLGFSLGIATIVLLISTRNIIVTFASMFSIVSALACVVGTIVAMGWELGSNESLCIMILPGFAVDYVVHLSHAYMESNNKARIERVHDAVRDLGISVFWGMLTSLFAAVTLATCSIQSLSKFGVFFALTISYAYLWAVLFLMPLLAFIGPEPKEAAKGVSDMEIVTPSPLTKESITEAAVSAPPSPPGSDAGVVQPTAAQPAASRGSKKVAPHVV